MGKPDDHLVHTARNDAPVLDLGAMTGLARLAIERRRLEHGEHRQISAGTERFLYVLDGAGSLRSETEAATESVTLGAGDFVALTPDESAILSTDQGIAVLIGQSGFHSG